MEFEGSFTIMSFNIEYGGSLFQPDCIDPTPYLHIITSKNVDVVAFQESQRDVLRYSQETDVTHRVAQKLRYHYLHHTQTCTSVVSRYPISAVCPKQSVLVVEVTMPTGKKVRIANMHYTDLPCTHYWMRGLEYDGPPKKISAEQAANLSYESKQDDFENAIRLLDSSPYSVMLGDFNEPSDLDWCEEAVNNGILDIPVVVPWNLSRKCREKGLVDVVRKCHPDILHDVHPTCDVVRKETITNPSERIDFVYASEKLKPIKAETIKVNLSDHLPIVATFKLLSDAHVCQSNRLLAHDNQCFNDLFHHVVGF